MATDVSKQSPDSKDLNIVVGNIEAMIKVIRGQQVLLDKDLAALL